MYGQKSNESSPNFSNLVPKFAPNVDANFPGIFSGYFALFPGNGSEVNFTKKSAICQFQIPRQIRTKDSQKFAGKKEK